MYTHELEERDRHEADRQEREALMRFAELDRPHLTRAQMAIESNATVIRPEGDGTGLNEIIVHDDGTIDVGVFLPNTLTPAICRELVNMLTRAAELSEQAHR